MIIDNSLQINFKGVPNWSTNKAKSQRKSTNQANISSIVENTEEKIFTNREVLKTIKKLAHE
ncbi:hypothetical protein [Latilactobacillus sakei]|uniref:hypothetical protein n=1 Tax=Latilactobacillus sakei TaxID=1599 RepID=UPI00077C18B6|nr:hypothetical protein [Latilactobacillus sakei]MDM5043959.1 hypothetical protein [Latilactobacillus sakei]MDR7925135.1 hypothetical protein [Latilactobacillus sakei subsp. sakei]WEY49712.1 hypothetical protein P3T66_06290 [Latilactobacillus sakei]